MLSSGDLNTHHRIFLLERVSYGLVNTTCLFVESNVNIQIYI